MYIYIFLYSRSEYIVNELYVNENFFKKWVSMQKTKPELEFH